MATKACTKCGVEKSVEEFGKNKCRQDGFNVYCKKCVNRISVEQRNNNKAKFLEREKLRRQTLGYKEYHKKYYVGNKEHLFEVQKEYRTKNIDSVRKWCKKAAIKFYYKNRIRLLEEHRGWRAKNKDKLIAWNHSFNGKVSRAKTNCKRRKYVDANKNTLTAVQWQKILDRQNNCCLVCGVSFGKITATMDHIIPVSRGGGLVKDNIQGLCCKCNASKLNKTMDEYIKTDLYMVRKDSKRGQKA